MKVGTAAQRLKNRTIKCNSSSTFKSHCHCTAGNMAFLACHEEQSHGKGHWCCWPLAYRYMDKLADGVDCPKAVSTDNLWKWSYSSREAHAVKKHRPWSTSFSMHFWQVCVLLKIIHNHVLGPAICWIWMSVELVWKYTKWNWLWERSCQCLCNYNRLPQKITFFILWNMYPLCTKVSQG